MALMIKRNKMLNVFYRTFRTIKIIIVMFKTYFKF